MSPKDRILNRLDQNDGDPKVSQRNKAELIVDLQVSTKGKNKQELIALCNNNDITITHEVTKIKEGWVGKPKGLLQVLWERASLIQQNYQVIHLPARRPNLALLI